MSGLSNITRASLSLYRQMAFEGFVENTSTFSTILSMCSSARLFREACEVHCRAIVLGFSTNVYIGSALVNLYLRMGLAEIGLMLFNVGFSTNVYIVQLHCCVIKNGLIHSNLFLDEGIQLRCLA
ncbi:hypothetical protein ACS0TY_015165 [Phlomoides rotata]